MAKDEMFQADPPRGMPQQSSALIDELAAIYRAPTWKADEQGTEAGRLQFAYHQGQSDLMEYLKRWQAKPTGKRK